MAFYIKEEHETYEPNFYDSNYRPKENRARPSLKMFKTPMNLYDYLDMRVYSHNEYKKALSLFIWKHMRGHKNGALLVVGESGTGKTEMIRALSKIYPNIYVCDGSGVVPSGYRGNTQLTTHLESLDFTNQKYPPVLVIDEADKLFEKGISSWSDTSILSEMLKFIEGGSYNIGTQDKPRYEDTSKLGVILLGSFSALTDCKESNPIGFNANLSSNTTDRKPLTKDRILERLPNELVGRISQVVILDSFTEQDYYNILTDKRYSPIERLSIEYGLNLSIEKEKYKELAHNAFESHTGVRQLNSTVVAYLDEQLFENPKIKEISIK